ncbi:Uu.00g029680.m01.CDS01 [Anthostomella pinea]|uniref:aldehyde dehydrogenase (NAD(+)) n=1 Tax=Anthostomella pinea TaxID=933095 RepID=A0AAI8YCV7_9PEZI|nr:Uu.00g029680.m01.CDS01 [Anthostomella pinea]
MGSLGASNGANGVSEEPFLWDRSNLPKQLFINNEHVDSKNTKKLKVHNPKDGSLVADDIAVAGEDDVDAAVDAAEAAFPAWRKTSASQRRRLMLKLADLLEEHGDALAELTRITLGNPAASMSIFEIKYTAEAFRYFAGWTDKFPGETYPQDDGFLKIVRNEPLGVTAGITPWNCPLIFMGLKAGPALATANCFILKPTEKTPFASIAIGTLVRMAGFPPGVFQVLPGDGSTGALLASHMRIRKVSLTGSLTTGRKIQELAARSNLKRVTLELGGKSPAVIFDDCNLENAITWCVNGICGMTGQMCYAASRVYVQEGIYDKFVEGYKKAIEERSKSIGDPEEKGTMMGPLVDKIQHERVMGFMDRGLSQGTLLTGGSRVGDKGFFVQPTIFTNVAEDAEICKEEIFGPVAVLNSFKTEEEIIAKANDSNFGLMVGVFTQDITRAIRVSTEIDSGMVGINCVSITFLVAPFGGSKESGMGRENAINALRMYTEPKTVMVNLTY